MFRPLPTISPGVSVKCEEKMEELAPTDSSRKRYLKWRNDRRKDQRKHQNELVQALDTALPRAAFRNNIIKQGAGVRALGTSGRSMHQVLDDVVEYMKDLQAAGKLPARRIRSRYDNMSSCYRSIKHKYRRVCTDVIAMAACRRALQHQ